MVNSNNITRETDLTEGKRDGSLSKRQMTPTQTKIPEVLLRVGVHRKISCVIKMIKQLFINIVLGMK